VPTNFPTALDTFPSAATLAANTLNTDPHSALHGNLGDALAALEAKVGIDGSSVPSSLDFLLSLKAALASPTFTGTPSAPTAALGTNTTQLATTAFVLANAGGVTSFNTRTGAVTLVSGDVTGALGFSDFARTGQSNTFAANQGFGAAPQAAFWFHVGAGQNLAVRSVTAALQVAAADDAFNGYAPFFIDGSSLYLNRYSTGPVFIGGTIDLGAKLNIHVSTDKNIGFRIIGDGIQIFALDDAVAVYQPLLFDGSFVSLNRYSGGFVGIGTDSPASLLDLFGGTLTASANSSTVTKRTQAEWLPSWVDSTDATRKARVLLRAWDTVAREILRGEADGAGPCIGFLGASAVSRPAVTGSRGGNAAVASLLSALALLGLITDSTTV
jgi:hypothetical protein